MLERFLDSTRTHSVQLHILLQMFYDEVYLNLLRCSATVLIALCLLHYCAV
jgi:hypothetical protein